MEAIMVSVSASEIQKNFGEWHDRIYEGPVEITRYGRSTAFLLSAKLFHEMWACYRKSLPIEALSASELALISSSNVQTSQPYQLDDIEDVEAAPSFGRWKYDPLKIPAKPPVGHLIAYAYLWQSQSNTREDGSKTYPTAVVMAREDIGSVPLAYVLGISHKPPMAEERALEVPPKLKRYLGMDAKPTWIYTDQLNVFAWPGPDLRLAEEISRLPTARGGCVIGALPTDWFEQVKAHLAESHRLKAVKAVNRTA
jgi:hypothetical protein